MNKEEAQYIWQDFQINDKLVTPDEHLSKELDELDIPNLINRTVATGMLLQDEIDILRHINVCWTFKANRLLKYIKQKNKLDLSLADNESLRTDKTFIEHYNALVHHIYRYKRKLLEYYYHSQSIAGLSKGREGRTASLAKTTITKGEQTMRSYDQTGNMEQKPKIKLLP